MSYQGKHSHMDIHNFPKIDVHSEDFKHDELDDGKKICKTDKQEYANLFWEIIYKNIRFCIALRCTSVCH